MHVHGLEEAGSKGSGERMRKGVEVILEESDGVGVQLFEGSKLIRKRKDGKDYKYQCWEERGADVISDDKCACEKSYHHPTLPAELPAQVVQKL